MKVYFAALIDRSVSQENSKLAKKLQRDVKKNLKIPKSSVACKVHNSFIFLKAEKTSKKQLAPTIAEAAEATLSKHLNHYYSGNRSRLQKYLRTKQELKETAQIVKDFLHEIDPKLPKVFGLRIGKMVSNLPTEYCELQSKSMIALWHMEEEKKAQFHLSGFQPQVLHISEIQPDLNMEEMVDKLALLNFFWIFINPTLTRLREMKNVLELLDLGLQGTHHRSDNPKVQAKLEMFFRILSAKLSALQNVDKTISSIFELFNEPRLLIGENGLMRTSDSLKTSLRQMSWKINEGQSLLIEVRDKI